MYKPFASSSVGVLIGGVNESGRTATFVHDGAFFKSVSAAGNSSCCEILFV